MFKLYDCKLRLGGSVLNEIPKEGVTAPEIEVLRAIHGSDAVVDIKSAGEVERSSADERARLHQVYASSGLGDQARKKVAMIREIFGHDRMPLPDSLDGPAPPAAEAKPEPEADPAAAPIVRSRVPRPAKEPAQEPAFAA